MKVEAISVFNSKNCQGYVEISELDDSQMLSFKIKLKKLPPGEHGFHIHEAGNLLEGCSSCCSHFNPLNKKHGGLEDKLNRHLGDLGNIIADKNGVCDMEIKVRYLKLRGFKFNIIGRSIVVHADRDDLGKGNNSESLKTGNAGKRIGCGVIGYKNAHYF